ncbi:Hypothetical_protein [Hexamita inflata]|uniref:Hypothetical_protein n=1 Tax=Hexamita inflata TaxID=28002 RepID=A0AA86UMP0_9EUKA|nr:Hypothetical protein HINF_LOCUS49019 [Hexamita inflata]
MRELILFAGPLVQGLLQTLVHFAHLLVTPKEVSTAEHQPINQVCKALQRPHNSFMVLLCLPLLSLQKSNLAGFQIAKVRTQAQKSVLIQIVSVRSLQLDFYMNQLVGNIIRIFWRFQIILIIQ